MTPVLPNSGEARNTALTAIEWHIGDPGLSGEMRIATRINREGARRFAVVCDGWVLNKDGEWEYEVQPSSRDQAFYDRCRWCEFELAYQAAIRATPFRDIIPAGRSIDYPPPRPNTRGDG